MYLLLRGAGLLAAGRPARWLILTLAQFFAAVGIVYAFALFGWGEVLVHGTRLSAFCVVASFFSAGTLLFLLRAALPMRPLYALAALVVTAPLAGTALFPLIEPLALSYAVLSLGLARLPGLGGAARFGDVSYGLYLYAYPIQQMVQQAFAARLGFAGALGLSLAATLACAALSWHFIEKRALALKPARPSGASASPGRARLASEFPNPPGAPAKSAIAR